MSEFFAANLGAPPGNVLDWSSLVGVAKLAPGKEAVVWSKEEAFLAVLFAASTCDDRLSSEERDELLALVHRSRVLKVLSTDQLAAINVTIASRLRDTDTALRDACIALPEEMRPTAFAHALDLVLADGQISEDEADFLNTLILHLQLSGGDVERIADVILLKNRY
jgi:tellurite resistance protein